MREKFKRCPTCWNWFVPNHEQGTIGFYCSELCLQVHARHASNGVWRVCRNKECRQEFFTRDPRQRCCSDTCFQQIPQRRTKKSASDSQDRTNEIAYKDAPGDNFSNVYTGPFTPL